MDRRDFIKKSAVAAAATAIVAPVKAMLTKAEQTGLASEEAEPEKMSRPDGQAPKVLLVNGSPRSYGNTFCCLEEIEKQLQKHGLQTEIVQIGRKPVRMCINCGGCHQDGAKGCVFDDDMCAVITEKMATADEQG